MQKNKERKKHYVLLYILFLSPVIIAVIFAARSAISSRVTEVKLKKETDILTSTARTNAVRYMKDKYGIDAQCIQTLTDKGHLKYYKSSFLLEKVLPAMEYEVVFMEAAGREFEVCVSCKDYSAEGWDTYRTAEIEEWLKERIAPAGGLLKEMNLQTECAVLTNETDDSLWELQRPRHGFYIPKDKDISGGDFSGIDEEYGGYLILSCTGEQGMEDVIECLNGLNFSIDITAFDTEAHARDFADGKNRLEIYRATIGEHKDQIPYVPYILGRRVKDNDGDRFISYKLNKVDDLYYYTPDEKLMEYGCLSHTRSGAVWSSFAAAGCSEDADHPITPKHEYSYNGRYEPLYIYYPLDKLEQWGAENVYAAAAAEKRTVMIPPVCITDDHAVYCIDSECIFMFVYAPETE